MLVTKTRAAELAGVSRRTFYNHVPQKRISVVLDDDGNEKVELSELERVYGKEVVARNLKELSNNEEEGGEQARESSRASAQGSAKYELLLLKEQIKNLEEQKSQLENYQRREREQFQEEIETLRDGLKKAQDHHSQLSLLLTDQTQKSDGTNDLNKAIAALEKRIANQEKVAKEREDREQRLLKQNRGLKKALDEEKSRSFWQRLFG